MYEFEEIMAEKNTAARQAMAAQKCASMLGNFCPELKFVIAMHYDGATSSISSLDDPIEMVALLTNSRNSLVRSVLQGDVAGKTFNDAHEAANYDAQVRAEHAKRQNDE